MSLPFSTFTSQMDGTIDEVSMIVDITSTPSPPPQFQTTHHDVFSSHSQRWHCLILKAYISTALMLSLSTNTKLVAFYAPTTLHTIPPSKSTVNYFWHINPSLKLGCHPSPTTSLTSTRIYQQNNPTFTTRLLNTHIYDAKQNSTPP